MSVRDIKLMLNSNDKHVALKDFQIKQAFQLDQLKAQKEYLNQFLDNNLSIDKAFQEIEHKLDPYIRIKDKLLQAFPGFLGRYLYAHFGMFLDGQIDSPEKIMAYNAVIKFLDSVDDLKFDKDIQDFLTEQLDVLSDREFSQMGQGIKQAFNDYDGYIQNHKDTINWYMNYRNSEEFKASLAYRMQQTLKEFQEKNGYYEVFIPNLKISSESYKNYWDELHQLNSRFIVDFPQAKNIGSE